MNGFVDYLNSTNNVGGNSTGSLAESQVKSSYFDMVKVDRRLGSYISQTVQTNDYQAFILTGHAGDGKTSVLVQVLKALNLLHENEGLQQEMEYDHLYYVKDMSEIAEDRQRSVLQQALEAPGKGKTSMLISNTGPLLNTFIRLSEYARRLKQKEFSENDRISLQSKLLSQLDTNTDDVIEVEGYKFVLVNIARVDNVSFAGTILNKIINPQLWTACDNCICSDRCPIRKNVALLATHKERVSRFIGSFYRYLYENDRRMTIRQMVGQISYAITGNLSCHDIEQNLLKEPFFNYNFANLFFGYVGLEEQKDSSQIRGISQIKLLALDRIALDVDYRLFVNHDYSFFIPEIQTLLVELRRKHKKHYQVEDEVTGQGVEVKIRKAIRRFYLVFSIDQREDDILNQIFGDNYSLYEKIVTSKQPKQVLRNVQALMFKAMYIKNTGFLPGNTNELPLTLRREDSVFQNVMLVLGTVSKNDLVIQQKSPQSRFEDAQSKQVLIAKIKDEEFVLTLPMLTYFEKLVQGSISSNSNPALTHGIAKLDTLLLEKFGDELPESEDDCELRVLINTTNGQEIRCFAFDGKSLSIIF